MVKLKVGSPNRGATVDTSSISPDLSHYLRDDEAIDTGVANGTNTITGLATVFDAGTTKVINIAPGTDNRAGIFEIRDDQNNYVTESAGVYQNRWIVANSENPVKSFFDINSTYGKETLKMGATWDAELNASKFSVETRSNGPAASTGARTITIRAEVGSETTPQENKLEAFVTSTYTTLTSQLDMEIDAPTLTVPAITSSSADTCAATKKYVDDALAGGSEAVKKYRLNLSNTPTWVASSNTDYPYQAELRYLLDSENASIGKDVVQLQEPTSLGSAFAQGTLSPFVRYSEYEDTTTQRWGYQVTIYSKNNTVSIGTPRLKVIK